MRLLKETLERITDIDREAERVARARVNNLAKPMGSMGRLEDLYVQLAAITGEPLPDLGKRGIVIMSGDHGIVEEGIVTGRQEVTLVQTCNFVRGLTGVCALAKAAHAELFPVDVGIVGDCDVPGVRREKVRRGTANFTKGPAMTREEAAAAIEAGIRVATELLAQGYAILGTGEMGIGNTTPSAAVLSVLTGADPAEVTGMGANLPADLMPRKIAVVRQGIALNRPDPQDPLDVLAKVGGLEVGGMAGVMLGCAAGKRPVLVDGFISTVAALVAVRLKPEAREYMIPSHKSLEKGARLASEALGFTPYLDLDMRLGEGTGAALMFGILEAAVSMCREMASFEGAGIAVV